MKPRNDEDKKSLKEDGGVWRTIMGRKIFIKEGQSVTDAMKESGKFKKDDLTKQSESGKIKSYKNKLTALKSKL